MFIPAIIIIIIAIAEITTSTNISIQDHKTVSKTLELINTLLPSSSAHVLFKEPLIDVFHSFFIIEYRLQGILINIKATIVYRSCFFAALRSSSSLHIDIII